MNTAQTNPALMQLEDIVLPEKISQFPIAPGFWILALFIIALIIFAVVKIKQHRRYHLPRKAALADFEQLEPANSQFASDINTLLKRTAMSYFPREDFAKLDGDRWYQWLGLRLSEQDAINMGQLLKKRYQKDGLTLTESTQLHTFTEQWLNKSSRFIALSDMPENITPTSHQSEASCSQ
ncbi:MULTISPECIES: DUF4381 domain-containing protein [unclassified Shewanella]|uniref:DUF4381 domain-containing protein n=1 Tax=unclassified Shewanella TaxID=196818 RepID=UPI00354C5BE2